MLLLWRLGLGGWGNGTPWGGSIMVIVHTGRRTGRRRTTPVNYAVDGEDVVCTAGFGRQSDWYRNLMADPRVEIWLPDGRWAGLAADITGAPDRVPLFRAVLRASGFAGPLFGVDHRKLADDDLDQMLGTYRLIRIRRTAALTGPGGPGDLGWVWPVLSLLLALLLLRRRKSPGLGPMPESTMIGGVQQEE